ncbi:MULTISPECIES: hypothetical protein [Anoxybacillaceae]|jgi:hypothetical protein|uniref:Uncharacterized protein n=1 Tax=Anoxybacteroides rupiense TaxID=311460 RepID=A0ABD5IR67_9BACL|nr:MULTISPECIES: hypothetical protein [Anoxybacillus]MBB3906771.1 hypothetical protein [Anoxybacillus rupiensis]MED5050757.1 hypothetical protein [Anoxybacillus rupiensis]
MAKKTNISIVYRGVQATSCSVRLYEKGEISDQAVAAPLWIPSSLK